MKLRPRIKRLHLPLFLRTKTPGEQDVHAEKASSLRVFKQQRQTAKTINKEQQLRQQKYCSHITADQTDVLYFHPFVAFFVTFLATKKVKYRCALHNYSKRMKQP